MTLRAFARQLGVAPEVVRKAVRSGRLKASVGQAHGRPVITDPVLAEREWREHRDGTTAPDVTLAVRRRVAALSPIIAARRRLIQVQTARGEVRLKRERGELVDGAALQREFLAYIVDQRRQLESLPGRLAVALPGLSPEDLLRIETEVRGLLTELANAPVAPRRDGSHSRNGGLP